MLAQWTRVGDVATAPVGPNRNPLTAKKIWSGRRGSNPRPRPWQGRALPLSYTRIRDVGDRSPATAELCQMQAANATVRTRPETNKNHWRNPVFLTNRDEWPEPPAK